MTYKEARVYLDKVSKYGSVLGLDTIRALLDELGNPQDDLSFIHIAGTNGKGSVLAYISTILSEAGYRVGRYVSPTVVCYLERIQVDGQRIPEETFTELVVQVREAIAKMKTKGQRSPTVFEVETAIAFLYFQKCNCDFVVLETGLGGTEDATNVVKNTVAAVFASISMDHMGFLGDTIEEIAANKAGIIKSGCQVVTTSQRPEVLEVLQKKAESENCPMTVVDLSNMKLLKATYAEQSFSYAGDEITISMAGTHQIENALTAYELIRVLRSLGYHISDEAMHQGFEKTEWIGRFTTIQKEPLLIVDGAHNEDAAIRLKESVEQLLPGKRLIFLMGVFKDKDYESIAKIMAPLADVIYTVNLPDETRTLDAKILKKTVEQYCKKVQAVGDIEKAVDMALSEAKEEDVILTFGSLSYLGRVIAYHKQNINNNVK